MLSERSPENFKKVARGHLMTLRTTAIICVSLVLKGGSLTAASQEPAVCGRLIRSPRAMNRSLTIW